VILSGTIAGLILTLAPSQPEIIMVNAAPPKQVMVPNVVLAKKMANAYGWKGRQWRCLRSLWLAESSFQHLARNRQGSSAFGIAQLLGETSTIPAVQITRGLRYVTARYGNDPCVALAFHRKHGYY
jgi:hypothetical protein